MLKVCVRRPSPLPRRMILLALLLVVAVKMLLFRHDGVVHGVVEAALLTDCRLNTVPAGETLPL